ncbi:hypothetical protein MHK_003695 [Candidatus Magnetomorum sp. HK-1]|nr:hypothetical protein MHK_003695 [Candidatus Magnetomorum sp. HK-1]
MILTPLKTTKISSEQSRISGNRTYWNGILARLQKIKNEINTTELNHSVMKITNIINDFPNNKNTWEEIKNTDDKNEIVCFLDILLDESDTNSVSGVIDPPKHNTNTQRNNTVINNTNKNSNNNSNNISITLEQKKKIESEFKSLKEKLIKKGKGFETLLNSLSNALSIVGFLT